MTIKKRKSKRSSMRLVAIILANLIVLLLLLGLLEGYCRYAGIPFKVKWKPLENSLARYDPELGWSYIPNKSFTESIMTAYFDKHGLRVPYPGFQFDKSKPSILFIGGSFTMGHGLSFEDSFVGKFASFDEVPYQVVNLGVQAYGSDQSMLALKKYFSNFNTKIVIYTFIEDHIWRNGNYDRRLVYPSAKFLGTKPLFGLNRNGKLYLKRTPLLYDNYIHSWLIDALKLKFGARLSLFPPYPEELTKVIIEDMKKYCENNGARFIVLNWRWKADDYNRLFQNINVEVIDTLEDAPYNWIKMEKKDKHPNAEANEHVAHLLLKYFQNTNTF